MKGEEPRGRLVKERDGGGMERGGVYVGVGVRGNAADVVICGLKSQQIPPAGRRSIPQIHVHYCISPILYSTVVQDHPSVF